MASHSSAGQRLLFMLGLILAGEAVFALPFHLARFFRPTMLEVFGLTATELGAAQGLYGVVAMLAYFPGGPLADRFPARKLMAWSLWSTAAGGLYMATFPAYGGTLAVFAFFGITTILLFWAALIRATREWGSGNTQGRAYGLLDGGRGVLAAGLASVGVVIFAWAFPNGYDAASFAEREGALRVVTYGYTLVTALVGIYVWFFVSESGAGAAASAAAGAAASAGAPRRRQVRLGQVIGVLRLPAVWLQALVVVCAYVAYKGFDNYSLYAVQGWGMDEVEAAQLMAMGAWLRPVAALGAGLLGDRYSVSRMLIVCFTLLLASYVYFATVTPQAGMVWFLLGNVVVASAAVFGLRGLYFALFEEVRVPIALTGTAVGVVSVIGFTPDIFVTLVAGILVDRSPGLLGHQHFFMFLAGFAVVGIVASAALLRVARRQRVVAGNG